MLPDRSARGKRGLAIEDPPHDFADGGTIERGIQRPAASLAQADAFDSQRRGEHVLGQLDGDSAHAKRLTDEGFGLESPLRGGN